MLDTGLGTREAGGMKWRRGSVLDELLHDPLPADIGWAGISAALIENGCTVVETDALHVWVVLDGRMARFHLGGVGTAWTYQLSELLAFLEEAA